MNDCVLAWEWSVVEEVQIETITTKTEKQSIVCPCFASLTCNQQTQTSPLPFSSEAKQPEHKHDSKVNCKSF